MHWRKSSWTHLQRAQGSKNCTDILQKRIWGVFLIRALTHLEVWAYYQNIARYQLVDSRYTSLLHCSRHRGDTAQTRWKFIRSRNGSLQNSRLTPTCHSLPFCNVWRFAQFSGCSSKRQSLTRSCQLLYVVRSQQRCLDAISILLRDG